MIKSDKMKRWFSYDSHMEKYLHLNIFFENMFFYGYLFFNYIYNIC